MSDDEHYIEQLEKEIEQYILRIEKLEWEIEELKERIQKFENLAHDIYHA